MRTALSLAFVFGYLSGAALAQGATAPLPPPCRIDRSAAPEVTLAATEAFHRVGAMHPLGARRILVNPVTSSPGDLPLYVVEDARVSEVDARGCLAAPSGDSEAPVDPISVRGICFAADKRIFCSAGALSAILGPKRDGTPFLFFLLSHELTHIALGHVGASMGGQTFAVDLAAPIPQRLSALLAACQTDEDQIERETAADEGALAASAAAFPERPFARTDDKALSIVDNAEAVYQAYHRLLEWAATYYGNDSPLVAPGRHSACEVLQGGTGQIELPELGGDHPHSWRRIGALVRWAARQAITHKQTDDNTSAVSIWQTNALTDSIQACGKDIAVAHFCRDVKLLAAQMRARQQLDCSNIRPGSSVSYLDDRDIDSCGFASPPPEEIKVADLVPPTVDKPVEKPAALFLEFRLLSMANVSQEQAIAVGSRAAKDIGTFLAGLAKALHDRGGFILQYDPHPVEVSSNAFTGAVEATSQHDILAAVPNDFRLEEVPGYAAVKAFGRNDLAIVPLADARYEAILHFNSDPQDSKKDSKRVLTASLPLDAMYDFAEAKAGRPARINPAFAHLICYTRERLRMRWPADWTLEEAASPEWAFYLGARNNNVYFPHGWQDAALRGCRARPPPDRRTRALLSRAYDAAREPDQFSQAMFDRVFGHP